MMASTPKNCIDHGNQPIYTVIKFQDVNEAIQSSSSSVFITNFTLFVKMPFKRLLLCPFHTATAIRPVHLIDYFKDVIQRHFGNFPGRRGYLTKFNTGRLRPEVQPLALLYTILAALSYRNKSPRKEVLSSF